ncbi:MAG TPA: glucoamylase family protein [Methylovirgula sp.]|nr:glucoamylase family protein [Methylovirgula sp.]
MAKIDQRESKSKMAKGSQVKAARPFSPADLSDEELLDCVQRQTFRFFWEAAHLVSGLAPDRRTKREEAVDDRIAIGGSGFGIMAIIVAVARGWVSREEALDRLGRMLDLLTHATCFHGIYPHFMNGRTGAPIPMSRKNDGGDLVETSYLFMGLLCARQAFDRDSPIEQHLRQRITMLWEEAEWNWHTRDGREVLFWHWSPNNGWAIDHEIRGWNECLITYVLAASSPRYAIDADVYHQGFAAGREFLNGKTYYGIELPLGPPYGGPLFFAHYSFCGLDPHGLKDRYADYWEQNVRHVMINREHCIRNPQGHKGYGAACWGLTASDGPSGYEVHAPNNDNGTISPTATLSSFPYAPKEAMQVLRHFFSAHGDRIWGSYGFVDAFCEAREWYASTFLAINQGPIVIMIENYRTGLLWKLFMKIPEIQAGLRKLGFTSPYLEEIPNQ